MKTANSGKKPSKLRRMFGSRFKAGSYSAFAAAVVIAIAVLARWCRPFLRRRPRST
ncbi:MAG: hypothetical protein PUJ39_02045 [Eubacteriales bacterium]|nr:hypothetical protein [Eubacteriales bacterium]